MILYITADSIGDPTGGGTVTRHELNALEKFAGARGEEVRVFRPRDGLPPFEQDRDVLSQLRRWVRPVNLSAAHPDLAHVYAGCFTHTVGYLREYGFRVSYTVAAHDVTLSRKAHEEMGIPFDYPHLNDPAQFHAYVHGYVEHADVVICPSSVSEKTVRGQGRKKPVRVIPHGVFPPDEMSPYRGKEFRVGYMGATGADKGLLTLARAWALFNGGGGHTLHLAGRHTRAPWLREMFMRAGCTGAVFHGWVDDVSSFYNSLSVYVQPSNTEGYGMEVTEAMAHGVPVICSDQAGAQDHVPEPWRFRAGDHEGLARKLSLARDAVRLAESGWRQRWRELGSRYTWERVESEYIKAWEDLTS